MWNELELGGNNKVSILDLKRTIVTIKLILFSQTIVYYSLTSRTYATRLQH